MQQRKLFTSMKIGGLELKNRIILAPIDTSFEPLLSPPSQRTVDYLDARAQGGVGLIMLGAKEWARMDAAPPLVTGAKVYQGINIAIYKQLVDLLHSYNAKVGIQLSHQGRQSRGETFGYQPVAPSPLPWSPSSEVPRELSSEEIDRLIERFAEGAARAKKVGFDLVEIHGAHGYLISNFLSPLSNKRTDDYGGDIRGRARFAIEIVKRIKEKAGADFPVSFRLNGADHIPGGLTLEDAKNIAWLLVEAGVDMISVSAGTNGSYPLTIAPFDFPPGCYVHLAEGVKRAVSVPVATAGRINDYQMAEEILLSDKADLIVMGRGLLADPELPNKALRSEFDRIRKCIGCNYCFDNRFKDGIACTVNPALGRERKFKILPAVRPKKLMVIGGGLAGLEAARVAALRGHRVTLFEEDGELGGQWNLAATPPYKQGFKEVTSYLERELKRLGVKIVLRGKVTPPLVEKQNPDTAVIATGALPSRPPIPGSEQATTTWDVLQGKAKVGHRVLVVGGSSTGLEVADFLTAQGKQITIVEMLESVAKDLGATIKWHLFHRLRERGVEIVVSTEVKSISPEAIIVSKKGVEETWKGFDSVVLATGVRP